MVAELAEGVVAAGGDHGDGAAGAHDAGKCANRGSGGHPAGKKGGWDARFRGGETGVASATPANGHRRRDGYGRTPSSFASFTVLKSARLAYHLTRMRLASFVSRLPTRSTVRPPGAVSPLSAPSPNCMA